MCPYCISECSGIRIFGKRIKSIAFSTDVAIIKNINADAIIAVYPFTPQAAISQSIISISDVPVFVGVGGGLTGGKRSVLLAAFLTSLSSCFIQGQFFSPASFISPLSYHTHIYPCNQSLS